MAEDKIGIFNFKLFDKFISVLTYEGRTSEYFGDIVTSSKVSASFIGPIIIYI
jgi:hypothetical protein